ncbi:unnamed protein product, partial [marine sediment metagenome]
MDEIRSHVPNKNWYASFDGVFKKPDMLRYCG